MRAEVAKTNSEKNDTHAQWLQNPSRTKIARVLTVDEVVLCNTGAARGNADVCVTTRAVTENVCESDLYLKPISVI